MPNQQGMKCREYWELYQAREGPLSEERAFARQGGHGWPPLRVRFDLRGFRRDRPPCLSEAYVLTIPQPQIAVIPASFPTKAEGNAESRADGDIESLP